MAEAPDSPEKRLRSLIYHFLEYLLDPDRPTWKRRLMAREIWPTRLVRSTNWSKREFLIPTLREFAGDKFSRRQLSLICTSVMGQCHYFLLGQPMIERLNPDFKIGKAEIAEIAEHITRFSLAGIAELSRPAHRS